MILLPLKLKILRQVAKNTPVSELLLWLSIKNTRTPFSIDFGVGDVIVPKQEKRKIPTQLDDFTAPVVNTYSLETTIAEKIDAIPQSDGIFQSDEKITTISTILPINLILTARC